MVIAKSIAAISPTSRNICGTNPWTIPLRMLTSMMMTISRSSMADGVSFRSRAVSEGVHQEYRQGIEGSFERIDAFDLSSAIIPAFVALIHPVGLVESEEDFLDGVEGEVPDG